MTDLIAAAIEPEKLGQQDWDELLVQCAEKGLQRGCEIALIQGANIDARVGRRQVTALHEAIRDGHDGICRMLLERGADPNVQDWQGNNLVAMAWMYRRREIGLMLIAYGAKPFLTDKERDFKSGELKTGNIDLAKQTPAIAALKANLDERLQQIVTAEDAQIDDQEFKTLVKMAREKNKPEVVAMLQASQAQRAIKAIRTQAMPKP